MLHGTVGQAAPDADGTVSSLRASRALQWLVAIPLFASFAWFFTRPARLFDADSYLHLALARTIAAHGFVDQLGWARFSTLGQHYGDKELLFHLLLVPFVRLFDPELGGKLALALICTALAWSLWRIASHALGERSWIVPVLVFGSGSFALRALRLRPELLAVLLLVWIAWALARERYRVAAALACAFALAHTAFHSLIGLSVAWFVWFRLTERRWNWQLLAAVWTGVAAGVLIHPQFPNNLDVFWVQNVDFFRLRSQLAVGGEFQPHTTFDLLQLDGVFWIGVALLIAARVRGEVPVGFATRMTAVCAVAAAAFGLLFAQMGRFATLFVPFIALAIAFGLRARSFELGPRVALPAGRTISTNLALAGLAAMSCINFALVSFVNWQIAGSFDPGQRRELERVSRLLPHGARVAASWNDAELYAFYAPHGRYLNIYDPVFMAVGDPIRHAVWTRVLSGDLADLPGWIAGPLQSEYIAFVAEGRETLAQRLAHDPRAKLVSRGQHLVYRIDSSEETRFVRDWTFESGRQLPITTAFIDVRAELDARGCATVHHTVQAAEARVRLFEFAGWGPSTVFIDGQQRLQLPAASRAILGTGVALPIQIPAGTQRWTVRTCVDGDQGGFYWLER